MRELHFYLLSIAAIIIAGFSLGMTLGKDELKKRANLRRESAGVEKPSYLSNAIEIPKSIGDDEAHERQYAIGPTLIQILSSLVGAGYAVGWMITFVRGEFLLWIPAVVVWLIFFKKGKDFYCASYKQHRFHDLTSIGSALILIGGYYYLKHSI